MWYPMGRMDSGAVVPIASARLSEESLGGHVPGEHASQQISAPRIVDTQGSRVDRSGQKQRLVVLGDRDLVDSDLWH